MRPSLDFTFSQVTRHLVPLYLFCSPLYFLRLWWGWEADVTGLWLVQRLITWPEYWHLIGPHRSRPICLSTSSPSWDWTGTPWQSWSRTSACCQWSARVRRMVSSNTGLWLAHTDHVIWILTSHWSPGQGHGPRHSSTPRFSYLECDSLSGIDTRSTWPHADSGDDEESAPWSQDGYPPSPMVALYPMAMGLWCQYTEVSKWF